MSSTTRIQRGQVLVLFAGGVAALLIVAALAFDAGVMLLERRDQQNAADAAAIAGARYLPGDQVTAEAAARKIATANGFTTGAGSVVVDVAVPPGPSTAARYRSDSSIEVTISSTRPSVFAGIMGVVGWPVGARAVATNQDDVAATFAMLALEEDLCQAIDISGSGQVVANGNIQANSTCTHPGDAMRFRGNSLISIDASPALCSAVGSVDASNGVDYTCVLDPGAPEIEDPLKDLLAPPKPDDVARAMDLVPGTGDPDLKPGPGCPGSDAPATEASPSLCRFSATVDYQNAAWRMYPGLYPGGIDLQAGTFYMEPGIYWIGGGGFAAGGNGVRLLSVATTTTGPVDHGVLIFNSELPGSEIGPVVLNGSSADIDLYPLDDGSRWTGLVIFSDRIDYGGETVYDVTIRGSSSDLQVRGTIYVPEGQVFANGNGGTLTVDQVIADQFHVNGGGGTIRVLNDEDFVYKFIAAGLVE